MNKKIKQFFYHPGLYFFLLPIISLIFGSFFARQYTNLRLTWLVVFYLYLLINQLIETILLRIPKGDFEFSKKLLIALEIINFALIVVFIWPYSVMAAVTLFLYSLTIQLQFLFSYYQLEKIAAFIASFLKVILLNAFAFYLHTQFIPFESILDYLPVLMPYTLYELARIHKKVLGPWFKRFVALAYLLALIALWPRMSYFSLSFLLTLPLFWPQEKERERKDTVLFLVLFSFLYLVILWISSLLF